MNPKISDYMLHPCLKSISQFLHLRRHLKKLASDRSYYFVVLLIMLVAGDAALDYNALNCL